MLVLTVSKVPEVGELIAPLGDDSEGIFEESDDNKESADGWHVSVHQLVRCEEMGSSLGPNTYGLSGSPMLVSQSSILLVCSRI